MFMKRTVFLVMAAVLAGCANDDMARSDSTRTQANLPPDTGLTGIGGAGTGGTGTPGTGTSGIGVDRRRATGTDGLTNRFQGAP
jgi:hypothetical protein